jgi:hypothetical protein
MNNTQNRNPFMTYEDAINDAKNNLNKMMVEYDRWLSQNPEKLIVCLSESDPKYNLSREFREKKQAIKLLKFKIKELTKASNEYQNTPKKISNS